MRTHAPKPTPTYDISGRGGPGAQMHTAHHHRHRAAELRRLAADVSALTLRSSLSALRGIMTYSPIPSVSAATESNGCAAGYIPVSPQDNDRQLRLDDQPCR